MVDKEKTQQFNIIILHRKTLYIAIKTVRFIQESLFKVYRDELLWNKAAHLNTIIREYF